MLLSSLLLNSSPALPVRSQTANVESPKLPLQEPVAIAPSENPAMQKLLRAISTGKLQVIV